MLNRRDSLKLLLAASGSSAFTPLWAAANQLTESATTVRESPQDEHMKVPRELLELDKGWRVFLSDDLVGAEAVTFDDQAWEQTTIPHTWQSLATQTDYSHCWYRKHFSVSVGDRGKRIYLRFDGAGIMTEVYLNGGKLGRHVGAYTAFIFDATDHIKYGGDNVLAVRCDNKSDIRGNLSRAIEGKDYGYFCVAAGLYRPVWLFKTDPCHVSPLDYGSSGISITEIDFMGDGVTVSIKSVLRNTETTAREFMLRHTARDAEGKAVGSFEGRITVGPGKSATLIHAGRFAPIVRWCVDDPRLYYVQTDLLVDGIVRDTVVTRTGFRSIEMADGQVVLNGQPIHLFGASLHEISERNFHAITKAEIRRDLESLKEVGFNSAFLAHYPHSQYAYDLADEMGLLVWAEDGFVNGSYEKEVGAGIVRELVRQYYNHPCIFCWSASNEPNEASQPPTTELLGVLKSENDSRRLITFNNANPFYGFYSDPQADFVTASVFSGWYPNMGDLWSYRFPYVNQTGGGAVVNHQSDYRDRYYKVSVFEPEGYQLYLAEIFSKRVYEDRDYSIHFWWAMKDFEAKNYRNTLNTKGLVTFAWYRKDVYYLFQSCLRKNLNVLHICGKHWFLRSSDGNAIKVYSNSKQVQLRVNGIDHGSQTNGVDYSLDGRPIKNVFYWEHVLVPGRNEVSVTDGINTESCVVYFAPQGKMPEESGSLVADLRASNAPVWAVNRAPEDQWPVYAQFDGGAGNTFDAIPKMLRSPASGSITWIVTRRQSDPGSSTQLAFSIAATVSGTADVWLIVTKKREMPSWISQARFKTTGLTGQWRNDSTFLVDYEVFKKECSPRERVELRVNSDPIDYSVFVTANENVATLR